MTTWNRQGTVLSASLQGDQDSIQEPSVIWDTNPVILTQYTSVFKMWFTSGWGVTNVGYAESIDGVNWTRYPSAIIAGYEHGTVFKNGNTYYYYGIRLQGNPFDQFTSPDGVVWTKINSAVLSPGTAGSWDDGGLDNPFVWVEGTSWFMLYEATGAGRGYRLGLATSPDGVVWTKSPSNPVISVNPSGAVSGPEVHKIGSTYYLWTHTSSHDSPSLPSDFSFYTSTDLVNWSQPITNPFCVRVKPDEGVGNQVGQIADISILEVGGKTYLFHDATSDGSQQSGLIHIKLMTSALPLSQIVTSAQTSDTGPLPSGNNMAFTRAPLSAVLTDKDGYQLNLGGASGPFTGAPTSIVLTDANGNTITVGTGGGGSISTSGQGYFYGGMPELPVGAFGLTGITNALITSAANVVRCIQFVLPFAATITKATWITVASAGDSVGFAIYSADRNSKLFDTGAVVSVGAAAAQTATVAAVTLPAGVYWFAWTQTGTPSTTFQATAAPVTSININTVAVKIGTAANAATAGALPASLGAITGNVGFGLPLVLFEP